MTPPDALIPVLAAGSSAGPRTNPVADVLASVMGYFSKRDDMAPQNEIVTYITAAYLDQIDPTDPPTPRVLEKELLAIVGGVIKAENFKAAVAAEKYPLPRYLTYWQVAQILLCLHHVIRIAPNAKDTDREYDLLAMYQAAGRARGTYTTSEDDIRTTARMYNTQLTLKEFAEVLAVLREDSPRRHQSTNRDFIAARNGIVYYGSEPLDDTIFGKDFHFEPKQVHPFDPAIVLLTKNDVDYVDDAPQQVITHPEDGDWEVVAWIEELFDQPGDEGLADLIWEIIGAIIRPHVRWGKTAWFYSEQGNNGKGTLCALMRNLVGSGAHTSIALSDFGKDFALEPLVRANAIIVDENDVGTFIDKAANLKAIVTNDVIQINRKYRMPIAYQFFGFMVQCLNEFPRVKDKSESFYRRQLFVPFTKSFTGAEKKYIKDDYLQRREVLEYVFWYAINRAGASSPGDYYQLSEPVATKEVLAEYKEANDPVRAFWEEFRGRLVWDLAPFTFLYDLYKAWFAEVSPSGSPVSNKAFITDLVAIVRPDALWYCPDKNRKIRPGQMMHTPEVLIAEYELKKWMHPNYTGRDPKKKSQPTLQANYRGLLRQTGASTPPGDTTDEQD
ncbi:DNA primase family protein [Streptomyces sp. WI04-05B]|uniref:DNA primase family protein n=1 Tax=Streptomyces TaxID=1883 RepID=UPI0029AB8DC9|nr:MULTISPECIES: phage/plasmid primase, P4 family [unclassified Streptomyces]MDX2547484.1 phage/plasmid primase, P4 family [Streptomyces sp. WI04-05B]MDX2589877.1 phage/plasmid primase, P4 family [Streptomyces sp. WI04-05A]